MQLCRLIAATPSERAKHEVFFYSDSLDNTGFQVFRHAGISLHRIARERSHPWRFLRRLSHELHDTNPDIVHCWLASAALWGRWAAASTLAGRIILSFRSTRIDMAPLLRISRRVDGKRVLYLANSSAVASALKSKLGVQQSRITVIHNGIAVQPHRAPGARDALLRAHRCPEGTRIVTMVGRLTDAKNYPMFLRIAARSRSTLPVRFFIVGHGELEPQLKAMSREMAVDDRVVFLGLRQDVSDILAATDVFCYTSRFEGFPNALLEAMAAGLPIITTRFAGVEDLVRHGTSAHVVEQDDDAAAFLVLQDFLSNPQSAATLASTARTAAASRFGIDRMVMEMLAFYERARRTLT